MDGLLGVQDDPRKYSMSSATPGACTLPQPSHRRPFSHISDAPVNNTARSNDGLFSSARSRQFSTHDRLFQTIDTEPAYRSRKHFTNKPDRTLYVDDIEGARATRAEFHTQRVVNPLEPKYQLPSCEVLPPPEPRFIRDSINVDDIAGTKPLPLYPWRQRETFSAEDIEGAKAGWKPRHKLIRKQGEPRDYMDVSDISGPKKTFRRDANSLEPRYHIHGLVIEDDPVKSKPRALPKAKNTPNFSLYTADIEGAQPGWIPEHKVVPKAARISNNTKDIPGAQADTLKRVLHTKRQVNPLDPTYTSLDGYALEGPFQRFYEPKPPTATKSMPQSSSAPAAVRVAQKEDTSANTNGVVVPVLSPMPTMSTTPADIAAYNCDATTSQSADQNHHSDGLPDDPLAGVEAIHERLDTYLLRQSISAPSDTGNRSGRPIAFSQRSHNSNERPEALRPTITNRSQSQANTSSPHPPTASRSSYMNLTPRSTRSATHIPGTPQSMHGGASGRKMSRSFTPASSRPRSNTSARQQPLSVEEKKYVAELEHDIASVRALS